MLACKGTLLATCQKFQGPSFWEVMNSFALLAYESLTASKTFLQQLLACLNLTLIHSVGTNKKAISINYGSSTSSWKIWKQMRLDLIFTMRNIYIKSNLKPLTKFFSSNGSTEFKYILPWNMSQMITKTVPLSTKIIISYAMKQGIPFSTWQKVNEHWKPLKATGKPLESHCRRNTSITRKKEIQKSRTVGVTVRDPIRNVNHLSEIIWDTKIIRVYQVYHFHQNELASPWWTLKSP